MGVVTKTPEVIVPAKGKTFARFSVTIKKGKKARVYTVVARKHYKKIMRTVKEGTTVLVEGRPTVEVYEKETKLPIGLVRVDYKGRIVVRANSIKVIG